MICAARRKQTIGSNVLMGFNHKKHKENKKVIGVAIFFVLFAFFAAVKSYKPGWWN
jgi:hypothetical protein